MNSVNVFKRVSAYEFLGGSNTGGVKTGGRFPGSTSLAVLSAIDLFFSNESKIPMVNEVTAPHDSWTSFGKIKFVCNITTSAIIFLRLKSVIH